jgi:hypothetical protein
MDNRRVALWAGVIVVAGAATGLIYYFVSKNKQEKSAAAAAAAAAAGQQPSGQQAPSSISNSVFDRLPDGTYPIVRGKKSKRAYILQTALNRFGYNLAVDGIPGNKTFEAVKKLTDWVKTKYPQMQVDAFNNNEISKKTVGQIVNGLQITVKSPGDSTIVAGIVKLFNQYP